MTLDHSLAVPVRRVEACLPVWRVGQRRERRSTCSSRSAWAGSRPARTTSGAAIQASVTRHRSLGPGEGRGHARRRRGRSEAPAAGGDGGPELRGQRVGGDRHVLGSTGFLRQAGTSAVDGCAGPLMRRRVAADCGSSVKPRTRHRSGARSTTRVGAPRERLHEAPSGEARVVLPRPVRSRALPAETPTSKTARANRARMGDLGPLRICRGTTLEREDDQNLCRTIDGRPSRRNTLGVGGSALCVSQRPGKRVGHCSPARSTASPPTARIMARRFSAGVVAGMAQPAFRMKRGVSAKTSRSSRVFASTSGGRPQGQDAARVEVADEDGPAFTRSWARRASVL